MRQRFLFRCDAGRIPEVGTGHARRCILLAKNLSKGRDADVRFVMRDLPEGVALVLEAGFPVATIAQPADEAAVLAREVGSFDPHVCILDVLDTTPAQVEACRSRGAVVATLDDLGAGLSMADLAINGIRESPATPYSGPEYAILPPAPPPPPWQAGGGRVLLSFGGYDHRGIAQRTLAAVRQAPGVTKVQVVATGADADRLGGELAGAGAPVEVLRDVADFPARMAAADVAVVGGGLTLFEALRAGTPAIVVSQYDHQVVTAARYAAQGAAVDAGLAGPATQARVGAEVASLLADPGRRERMSKAGRTLVDGRGLDRVADLVGVFQFLQWDTEFFRRRIGQITTRRLSLAIVAQAIGLARQRDVECLYYLADCHHSESVQLAERHGFHFVDIRLTFERDVAGPIGAPGDGPELRPAVPADVPALKAIAAKSYEMSRYYFDEHFPRERCRAFYTEWIEKSCRGYADAVFVAVVSGRPAGYITCRRRGTLGTIELVGIAEHARGAGVGRAVVGRALQWFQEQGLTRAEVVTQGRNYAAQRLYQRAGFVTKATQLWYHRWSEGTKPT